MRLLRRRVSFMWGLGMFCMGFGLAVAFAPEIAAWRGLLTWGVTLAGVLLVLGDSILTQAERVRARQAASVQGTSQARTPGGARPASARRATRPRGGQR